MSAARGRGGSVGRGGRGRGGFGRGGRGRGGFGREGARDARESQGSRGSSRGSFRGRRDRSINRDQDYRRGSRQGGLKRGSEDSVEGKKPKSEFDSKYFPARTFKKEKSNKEREVVKREIRPWEQNESDAGESAERIGKGPSDGVGGKWTLFVRNIPLTTTDVEFGDTCRAVAPVRSAFIVKDKEKKSKGFGYASFYREGDMKRVLLRLDGFEIAGRALKVVRALDSKMPAAERELATVHIRCKILKAMSELKLISTVRISVVPSVPVEVKETQLVALLRILLRKPNISAFVRKRISDANEEWGVQFGTTAEAVGACGSIDALQLPRRHLTAFLKIHVQKDVNCKAELLAAEGSAERRELIVRNIDFRATKEQVFDILRPLGVIKKWGMGRPKQRSGNTEKYEHGGFALVTYRAPSDAATGLQKLTGKKFFGRELIADWVVNPEVYEAMKIAAPVPVDISVLLPNAAEDDDEDPQPPAEPGDLKAEAAAAKRLAAKLLKTAAPPATPSKANDMPSESIAESVEQSEEGEDDEVVATESDDEDSERNSYAVSSSDEDEAALITPPKKRARKEEKSKEVKTRPEGGRTKHVNKTDAEEGRTIHVRNVPAMATTADLKAGFSRFGPVVYARIVKRDSTPTGTAFVKFEDVAAVEAAVTEDSVVDRKLKQSGVLRDRETWSNVPLDGLGVTVAGQRVRVAKAVTRDNVEEFKKARQKTNESSQGGRHLHLLEHAWLDPASHDIPSVEVKKRQALQKTEKAKMNSTSYHVNPNRLLFLNLPPSYTKERIKNDILKCWITEKSLQPLVIQHYPKLFQENTENPRKVKFRYALGKEVQQVSFVVNKNEKTKRLCFVSFQTPEIALAMLKHMNNNPHIWTAHKRPIVSFAMEDVRALQHRERLLRKLKATSRNEGARPIKAKRTYSRGKRQREKKQQQRIEMESKTVKV